MNVLLETRGAHERRWKRYPTYRDSGVGWLGAVPEGWGVKRLKYCAARINEKVDGRESDLPYTGLEHIESCTGRLTPSEEISTSEGQSSRYEPGDVLFGKLRPYLAKAFRAKEHGICTGELLVLRPKDVSQDYLFSYVLARDFISIVDSSTYGAKMPRASWDFIGDLPVLLPSEAEQRTIAAFLDRETGRIDALIAKKARQIELLWEKRAALISHAVTKGLDPDAPMKDSGVEWLGAVPAHWEMLALKRLASLKSGESITVESIDKDGDYPVFGGNGLRGYTTTFTHDGNYVLIGRQGALCGNINYAQGHFWASEHAVVVSPIGPVETKWLGELLRAMNLNQYSVSAAQPGRSVEMVSNLSIPHPPLQEQSTIAAFLNRETGRIDSLLHKIRESITKLREYRTARISAAVTGKIDVRAELVS
jgi:type I restriction enzyme S subunit